MAIASSIVTKFLKLFLLFAIPSCLAFMMSNSSLSADKLKTPTSWISISLVTLFNIIPELHRFINGDMYYIPFILNNVSLIYISFYFVLGIILFDIYITTFCSRLDDLKHCEDLDTLAVKHDNVIDIFGSLKRSTGPFLFLMLCLSAVQLVNGSYLITQQSHNTVELASGFLVNCTVCLYLCKTCQKTHESLIDRKLTLRCQ